MLGAMLGEMLGASPTSKPSWKAASPPEGRRGPPSAQKKKAGCGLELSPWHKQTHLFPYE